MGPERVIINPPHHLASDVQILDKAHGLGELAKSRDAMGQHGAHQGRYIYNSA